MKRPKLADCWTRFGEVYKLGNTDEQALALVAAKIGGKVKANIDLGVFANACPIRISYVLNHGGVPVPGPTEAAKSDMSVVSGADKFWYLFRVKDAMTLLGKVFGPPDLVAKNPQRKDFARAKGIMTIVGHGWVDATGHVSLWDGVTFSDKNHLRDSSDNGTFVPEIARLWKLP